MGINILVGAFVTSPDFDAMNKTALLDLQLDSEGAVPDSLKPNFTAGTTCIDEETLQAGGNVDTLIGILCNPTKQNIETVVSNNNSTTTGIVNTQTVSIEDQVGSVTDFSQTSVFSLNNIIAVLSGDFIFKAISALFVEDIANIPEEFILGWKVIIGLMYVGLIASLIFGRSLANAN